MYLACILTVYQSVNAKRNPHALYQNIRTSLAPQVGLEPTTFRLTAERSAIELLRNIGCGKDVSYLPRFLFFESGDDQLSRAVSSQVPSACGGLTSVFGMGTGGTLQLLSPEILFGCE